VPSLPLTVLGIITFSLAYVAVIIQSWLTGMGQDLEEAALDLGPRPLRVLMATTLEDAVRRLSHRQRALYRLRLALDDTQVTQPRTSTPSLADHSPSVASRLH